MTQWRSKKLSKKDQDSLTRMMTEANPYAVLQLRAAAASIVDFEGFFWAGVDGADNIGAIVVRSGNQTMVYCDEDLEALRPVANIMLSHIRKSPKRSVTYTLSGDARAVNAYYAIIGQFPRRVIADRKQAVWSATELEAPPKPGFTLERAKASDLRVVYEFGGEYSVEYWGIDPRRVGREGHQRRCKALIDSGRQLIGRDRNRPVFIAELSPAGSGVMLLDRVYVPRPLRIRKKLVTAAFQQATKLGLQESEEVLVFIDDDDALLTEVAQRAGFEKKRPHRLVVSRR